MVCIEDAVAMMAAAITRTVRPSMRASYDRAASRPWPSRRHAESVRLLAALSALPHGQVSSLDMAAGLIGIEQGGSGRAALQSLPKRVEQRSVGREPQCERLILIEARRHQLGK